MEKLLILTGMALATYFTRYAMIATLRREMHPLIRRWLRYVPVAVLTALIAPAALAPQGELELSLHVWAMLAGTAVAWRTRNVLLTIVGGMATFWLLKAFGA